MNFKKQKIIFFAIFISVFLIPQFSFGAGESIKEAEKPGFSIIGPDSGICTGKKASTITGADGVSTTGAYVTECTYADLIRLANRIIGFMIFFGTSIAVIAVAYAGFLYASSAGNSGQVEKAHGIFNKVVIGMVFMYGGWLLVATILKTLGVNTEFSNLESSKVEPVKKDSIIQINTR